MVVWVLRTLWTLPTTMVGVVIALPFTLFGARWRVRGFTLECHGGRLGTVLDNWPWPKGGISAITFGDLILGRDGRVLDECRVHEQVHVRQAHRWGPLFLPAYLGARLWGWWRGGDAYMDNPFEVEAYRVSDPRYFE
ncbi:MAG: hypothetical protein ACTHN5_03505 [Phycisphaerae bacterium]